jgi:hypothetical protein
MLFKTKIIINNILPKYIVFNNYLKYKLEYSLDNINKYGIFYLYYKNVMTIEEINKIKNRNQDLLNHDSYIGKQSLDNALLVDNYYKKKYSNNGNYNVNDVNNDPFKKEIFDLTFYHSKFEYWNITNLCRKYNINGKEVFKALCYNYDTNIYDDFDERANLETDYAYFDYYKNQGIKNAFPIDIYKSQFNLNMRRYNDRNFYDGYEKILTLFEEKIKCGIKYNYKHTEEDTKDNEGYLESKQKYIKEYDIHSVENINNKILDEGENKLELDGSNWRKRMLKSDYSKYPMLKPEQYDMEVFYKTDIEPLLKQIDFSLYFDYSDDKLIPNLRRNDLINVSIINLLLFSKTRINYESLIHILDFVRIKYHKDENNSLQIDNYIITHALTHIPKYSNVKFVEFDELDTEIKFAKSNIDKYNIAKYFRTLAHEFPPTVINHHNFYMLYKFEKENDNICNYIDCMLSNEEYRLETLRNISKLD